jgi:phosphoglycerate dehydrogenase-like enzyme
MKVVYYISGPFEGQEALAKEFSQIEFRDVTSTEQLAEHLPGAEVLVIVASVYGAETAKIIREKGQALRWLHFKTSGVDQGVRHGLPPGVPVSNTPALSAPGHAEHAFGALIMLMRKFREIEAARTRGDWIRRQIGPLIDVVEGKTMVVVGFGGIGQAVARYAKNFGMTVIVVSRAAKKEDYVDRVVGREQLGDVVAEADVVSFNTVLTPESRHMLGAKELARMKPTAYILNDARGALIDEAALAQALKERRIAGAALDVFSDEPLPKDSPFWTLDNVFLSPHVSGAGYDTDAKFTSLFRKSLKQFLAGEKPDNILGPERLTPG